MQAAAECFFLNENEKILLYHAKQIGSKAKALLAQRGFSGKVLAVISTTIYFVSRDGEILWLSQEALAMHRRCILASFRPRSVCPGQNFFLDGPFLRISDEVILDLYPASEWESSVLPLKHPKQLTAVRAYVYRLIDAVITLRSAKGLGQMIPLISSLLGGNKQEISNTDTLLARARNSVLDLAMACLDFNMTEVTRRGRELVGLGPGLTPSGDDFLGGLLFAAHSLKTAYPQDFSWDEELVTDLIGWASTQTHPISHALLRDHAFGHGPEPLHNAVVSLLNDQDLSRTMGGIERLLGIGETSGWDILAGMLTAMLLVEGKLRNKNGGKH
jgi:hypothetical protein